MLQRIISIIRTDILFRFRRTAAVITILIVAGVVYFIVPDISTGRTLIQINHGRVLYTSAAVALGTSMFCALFLSLVGYYIVSNSFRRDIDARTGFVIAATPITNTEYVVGKFIGNILYLTAFMLACMLSSMVMFLIRGEAALEPFVFLSIYTWLVMPTIVFSSAIALAFEALPLLSGRIGDVLFFFVWMFMLGFPAALTENGVKSNLLTAFDIVGLIPIIGFLREQFQTTAMSIGATTFDSSQAPVLLSGIPWGWSLIGERLSTLLLSFGVLALAGIWFHRFNPSKVKFSIRQSRKNFLTGINMMLKPVTNWLHSLHAIRARDNQPTTLINAVRADVIATLSLSPFTLVAIVIFAIISLSVDAVSLQAGILPAIIVVVILALADISTRDRSAGMMNLLFTIPHLKPNYVLWKCTSAFVLVCSFTFIPLVRLLFEMPNAALSLLIGSIFIASGAAGLGIITGSRKAFIGLFLMLLYIALNAKDIPAFDFAGIYGKATFNEHLGYCIASSLFIASAFLIHRKQLRL